MDVLARDLITIKFPVLGDTRGVCTSTLSLEILNFLACDAEYMTLEDLFGNNTDIFKA